MNLPPLSLYVHFPWCIEKCPYCDFNSHQLGRGQLTEAYQKALLTDLNEEAKCHGQRQLHSIFFGGGTPSLMQPEYIESIIETAQSLFGFKDNIEITLEANPGTTDQQCFQQLKQAGINRLSIGVQSFNNQSLKAIGRIHDGAQAQLAIEHAQSLNFNAINIDLMYGLPNQTPAQAQHDLLQACGHNPEHISWYELTIEPNTYFHRYRPPRTHSHTLSQIESSGLSLLKENGYERYEISAYSRDNNKCQHNLNYWRFGDYIGIGAGAHGKITQSNHIIRTSKYRHPKQYISNQPQAIIRQDIIHSKAIALEYMMNALRLFEPVHFLHFEKHTQQPISHILPQLYQAQKMKLIQIHDEQFYVTTKGHTYLNTLLEYFMPE